MLFRRYMDWRELSLSVPWYSFLYYIGLVSMKVINRIKYTAYENCLFQPQLLSLLYFGLFVMFLLSLLHHAEGFKTNLSNIIGNTCKTHQLCYIASLGLACALTPSKNYGSTNSAMLFSVYIHGLCAGYIFAPTSTLVSLLYFTVFILGFIYLVYWIVHLGSNLKLKLHL